MPVFERESSPRRSRTSTAKIVQSPSRFKGNSGRKDERIVIDSVICYFNQVTESMPHNHRIAAAKRLALLFGNLG